MRYRWAFVFLLAALVPMGRAESIWQKRSQRYGYLFNDLRARNVGDIVTVLVSEVNAVSQREQRQLKKATDSNAKMTYEGKTAAENASRTGSLSFQAGATSSRAFDGGAQLSSDRVFTDTLTATVVDVLPNGNLVIEGHRIRVVSGEQRLLRVTGIIRPVDISAVNSIPSAAVANFRIEYCGRGIDTNTTTRGWFGRAMDVLWPF